MEFINVNGARFLLSQTGGALPILLFSHGFAMNHTMFAAQVAALRPYFNCVLYDQRGHGQSEATRANYDMDLLVDDAIAIIEHLGQSVHFCGMSTGGFIGMRIAVRRPELLQSLVLMDTAAAGEPAEFMREYKILMFIVRYFGWRQLILNKVMRVLFDLEYLKNPNNKAEIEKWKNIIRQHDKLALLAFAKAIFGREDFSEQICNIKLPTLVIAGENDASTPIHNSKQMHQNIADSGLTIVPNCAHTAAIEQGSAVANALLNFYQQQHLLKVQH